MKTIENDFKYDICSNVIYVDGEKKYLDIMIWDEVTYEEIKKNIVLE